MSELLALLGLSWSRLLFYPGGLTALGLVWLWHSLHDGRWTMDDGRFDLASIANRESQIVNQFVACIPPLLLLSLLPLPGAAALGRQIDLPVALTLLEWPVALALLSPLGGDMTARRVGEERLMVLRISYTVLLLAVLTLTQSTRSLSLDALVAAPTQFDLLSRVLRVTGGVAWALALLPLLGLGAFDEGQVNEVSWSAALRAVGHLLLAGLPWMPLLSDLPLLLPLPPLLLALLLAAIHHLRLGERRTWITALRGVALVLLGLLAWAAGVAVTARLQ